MGFIRVSGGGGVCLLADVRTGMEAGGTKPQAAGCVGVTPKASGFGL